MSDSRIGRGGQVKVYVGKCFRTFFHEKGWKSLVSTAIIAVILSWVIGNSGDIYGNQLYNRNGLFAMICGCLWTGLFNSIQSICRERAIIKREHRTGLHISSYVFAHLLFELVVCLVEGLILTVIFGLFRGFPEHGVVFPISAIDFYIGFTLVIFASDALGILVSCIVKTENAAMTVMPFVLIVQLVLCGVIFPLDGKAGVVKDVTVSKWGLSALCSASDYNNMTSTSAQYLAFQKNSRKLEQKFDEYQNGDISDDEMEDYMEVMEALANGEEVDEDLAEKYDIDVDLKGEPTAEYESTTANIMKAWGVLIGYALLYTLIGILFLKLVDKDKR